MMNTSEPTALTLSDFTLPVISITSEALALKENALQKSALIGKVTNADENKHAVEAQIELKRTTKFFEDSRKKFKEPFLEGGRLVDRTVAAPLLELQFELDRIGKQLTAFRMAEEERVREERRLQQAELDRIERDKQAELDKLKADAATGKIDVKEAVALAEKVQEEASQKTYIAARPIEITREAGQTGKPDWEITVTNPYELARLHPECVTITPRLTEIKAALNAGRTINGIRATKVLKAGVRLAPERAAIAI